MMAFSLLRGHVTSLVGAYWSPLEAESVFTASVDGTVRFLDIALIFTP